MAGDAELAAEIDQTDLPAPEERLSRWSPEREVLAAIFDRLGELIATSIRIGGQSPPEIRSYPRPVTALQRLEAQNARERHRRLVERLIPT